MTEQIKKHQGRFGVAVALIIGLMFLLAALTLVSNAPPAAADTVPTPVYISGSSDRLFVTFFDGSASTPTDGNSSSFQLAAYEFMDLQWVAEHPGYVQPNTTTLKIQWSNDDTNWSDGPNIVANSAADGDGMIQVANLGRYTRVNRDNNANGNPVTFTVKAVAK